MLKKLGERLSILSRDMEIPIEILEIKTVFSQEKNILDGINGR